MERLQKVIANAGVCSRRKAEELIKARKVKVDGEVITELGTKVGEHQEITVDNIKLATEQKEYYLFNKPRGVVTTTNDDKGRKTVMDYIPTNKRIYPVGRLDYDTTGLLFLTNDGDLANQMMHPSSELEKVYIAKVKGIAKGEHLVPLKSGVMLDEIKVIPDYVKLRKTDKVSNTSIIEVVIHEGKNHQIKRMLAAVGLEVIKLKRERIGFLTLKGLESGEYRKLNPKEVKQLHEFLNKK
ncbi:MAG: pseudouridine synthase [Bacilli bacterium]